MDSLKIKSIIITNEKDIENLKIIEKPEIIIFKINDDKKYDEYLKKNKYYQKQNNQILYLVQHTDYNIIKKNFIRESDILIIYESEKDIILYNYIYNNLLNKNE